MGYEKGNEMRTRSAWVTPTLVTLQSGLEAEPDGNPKGQNFLEGSVACPDGGIYDPPNSGCPGSEEGELLGPS